MSKRDSFIFTGGGTGGHVAPALAIAEAVRAQHPEAFFLYVGVKGKAEDGMVQKAWAEDFAAKKANISFVRAKGFSGLNLSFVSFAFQLGLGILAALLILLRVRPVAIVATGGYVSAPIVFAAHILRTLRLSTTKIFIHEQNAVLGRMNKVGTRFADCVGTAFPGTVVPRSKKKFVGYPVRSSVTSTGIQDKETLRNEARKSLNLPDDAKVIFAFGGSQGARTINRGVVDALPILLRDEKVYVIHGTGRQLVGNSYNGMDDVQKRLAPLKSQLPQDWEDRYRPCDFFYNMGLHYNAADLVVCRGGAGSLYEVCANGVAAISIPKANVAGDHQAANARSLERLNAIRIIYERVDVAQSQMVESIQPQEFADLVLSLLADPELRQKMAHNAHLQYAADTTSHCAHILNAMLGKDTPPPPKEEPKQEREKVLGLSDTQLEALLRKVRRGEDKLSPEERRIALYKIDGWSAMKNLVSPARASRMIGEGRFKERVDVLYALALSKDHSPFTRRDAFKGLRLLEHPTPETMEVLLKGLKDDYFEAKVESLKCIHALLKKFRGAFNNFTEIRKSVLPLTQKSAFDVRMHALEVLAELCEDFSEISAEFKKDYFHPNWMVRKKIISCFERLYDRGLISEDEIKKELSCILQTSNGFHMRIELKEQIRKTMQKDERKKLIHRLSKLIDIEQVSTKEQIQKLEEFAKEERLHMNVTDVLERLLKQGDK